MAKTISDESTSLITARTPLTAFPVASLFITHGELAGREIPISGTPFFVGRSKNNNLTFNDKSVSRKHAVINSIGGEYIISDLESLKGTYINGKKVKEATINPGDVINIGENRMQFRQISPSGLWSVPGRGRWLKYFLILLLLGGVIGGATWYLVGRSGPERLPEEIMVQVKEHYDKGVELFNKRHDVSGAREEWKKILELDSEIKSDYAIKAAKLLKSTEAGVEKE